MYYKEKLTKNLADLNTFETSMSLRDRVTTSKNLTPLSIYICTYCPQVAQRCSDLTTYTGREITMMSLGNIALSLKDRLYVFKVRLQCLFFTLLLPLQLKELLASRPVVDTAVLLFI